MAARPYWRGQIRLALVSIPVEIFSATKSGAAVAFHQIYEPTGQRIKHEKTVRDFAVRFDAAAEGGRRRPIAVFGSAPERARSRI